MKRHNEQEMYRLCELWRKTGKSVVDFARENGLAPGTFYYWVKKFRKNHSQEAALGGFNLLNVSPSGVQQASVRISYPSGITVELFGSPEVSLLRSLTE